MEQMITVIFSSVVLVALAMYCFAVRPNRIRADIYEASITAFLRGMCLDMATELKPLTDNRGITRRLRPGQIGQTLIEQGIRYTSDYEENLLDISLRWHGQIHARSIKVTLYDPNGVAKSEKCFAIAERDQALALARSHISSIQLRYDGHTA